MGLLSQTEREVIVDQALEIVEKLYVHLPLKRAMHAVDPLQRLRLLRHRGASMSEPAFHAELLSIFTRLRDLHTSYILPEPLRSTTAYLPFRIEDYYEGKGKERRYAVSWVKAGSEDRGFGPGALVTFWNGVPIARAVELNADREAGSNPEARHACGLAAMTIRPLAMSLPPDELWVIVGYEYRGRKHERRFDWQTFTSGTSGSAGGPLGQTGDANRALGLDARAELERRARRLLFRPEAVAIERRVRVEADAARGGLPHAGTSVDYTKHSKIPSVFTFRPVKTPSGGFAYVRIHTFLVPEPDDDATFVDEFVRILGLLPQSGLILDVRGNPGGHIFAAERLLQVLTPRPIDPERFAFIVSPLTRQLCEALAWLADWKPSIVEAVETGAAFSSGFPLVPVAACNDHGQKYQGPVVLLTNARCYSATDIFSAGFQDHEIGPILGSSGATGAGGANVWDHELLLSLLPGPESPFQALPRNASFTVAVRRCTRVGSRNGTLVEDLGVKPDLLHFRTRKDVLKDDVDLIGRAAKVLKKQHDDGRVYSVTGKVKSVGPPIRLTVRTRNVSRLDVYLDGRPDRSLDVKDGELHLAIDPPAGGVTTVELRGYNGELLTASTRISPYSV
jgi:hypothetical protein